MYGFMLTVKWWKRINALFDSWLDGFSFMFICCRPCFICDPNLPLCSVELLNHVYVVRWDGLWLFLAYSKQNLRYSWFEHRVSNHSNTTGVTSGAGTVYPFGSPEFTLGFCGVCIARSLVFCVVFCRSLFVPFSFGHCIIGPSPIYRFLLHLWYSDSSSHNKSWR